MLEVDVSIPNPEVDISPAALGRRLRQFAPHAKHSLLDGFIMGLHVSLKGTGITNSSQRFCHLLAQIATESAMFKADEENLNYSADGLMKVFGVGTRSSAQLTLEEASEIAHKPQLIAERVYGVGNPKKPNFLGNIKAGDGWTYRGRGFLQLTGRDQYTRYSRFALVDLVCNPELAKDAVIALRIAAALWTRHHCNHHADLNHIVPITKAINGGINGLQHRKRNYEAARTIWG